MLIKRDYFIIVTATLTLFSDDALVYTFATFLENIIMMNEGINNL